MALTNLVNVEVYEFLGRFVGFDYVQAWHFRLSWECFEVKVNPSSFIIFPTQGSRKWQSRI